MVGVCENQRLRSSRKPSIHCRNQNLSPDLLAGSSCEREQRDHRNSQSLGNLVNRLERWRVDSPFDEAQKVYGYANQFCKLLLGHIPLLTNFVEPLTEILSERRHRTLAF